MQGVHFRYEGGQVRSLLSLISYLGSGTYRDRYLGIKIPPTNIRDNQLQIARTFAHGLADRLVEPVAVDDNSCRSPAGNSFHTPVTDRGEVHND